MRTPQIQDNGFARGGSGLAAAPQDKHESLTPIRTHTSVYHAVSIFAELKFWILF